MRSWRTTASGIVSAGASLVVVLNAQGVAMPKWLPLTAAFILAGGLATLGIAGKDYNVTGPVAPPSKDTATK